MGEVVGGLDRFQKRASEKHISTIATSNIPPCGQTSVSLRR